ncbi:MAG: biotin--[acetyl-CoA-carboxylase] ligase [Puniceicoccales bacterium]|jgi:BirA family biotin operon repressor/biotin-[acetyl-CoA-carboxylase] ligase|nr:biotin--[acetyl-CoA-carboxylase] ligase [Puniceicoccales bacterium]
MEKFFTKISRNRFSVPLILLEETMSTSGEAKAMRLAGREPPFIVLAKKQLAGYGQRGRAWRGDVPGNLYLSLALKKNSGFEKKLGIFPQHIALELCESFHHRYAADCMVKWPNDIFAHSKKMGGLLVETSWIGGNVTEMVLGIGINILFAPNIEKQAYLATCLADVSKTQIDFDSAAEECISVILNAVESFENISAGSICEKWKQFDMLREQNIELSIRDGRICGENYGIGEQGELLICAADGKIARFNNGNAEIRLGGEFKP